MGSGVDGSGKMRVGVKAIMKNRILSLERDWRFWMRMEADYPKK